MYCELGLSLFHEAPLGEAVGRGGHGGRLLVLACCLDRHHLMGCGPPGASPSIIALMLPWLIGRATLLRRYSASASVQFALAVLGMIGGYFT